MDQRDNGLQNSPRATNFTLGDRGSSGLQRNSEVENAQKAWEKCPRKCFVQENNRQMSRQSSLESNCSEQNHDMMAGANPTPHMVSEFLTGRTTQSREPLQHHNPNNHVSETTTPATPSDPINRLAEVLVGMNNRPSAQTLMVRPVSTNTLTFDGKSDKFELFEDLFHTMIEMQLDMTETMKVNIFIHYHARMHHKLFVTVIRQTDRPFKTSWQYFVENTSNPSPRRPPNTNGIDWCLTQTS